jgi:predicted metal-binding membrane protein
MALLFVVGVMNLLWVALLAAVVFVEKLAPRGAVIGRAAGVGMAAWAIYLLAVTPH